MGKKTIVIGVSGKRFTGKDTLSHVLHNLIQAQTTLSSGVATISQVFKKEFAQKFGYDYHRIMDDREYKEGLREKMNTYFHELMAKDPLIDDKWWNELVVNCDKNILICPDIRLKSDIQSLSNIEECKLILVRITCTDTTRKKLGWEYNEVVETDQTETDLDQRTEWDYEFENDGSPKCIDLHATSLLALITASCSP